MWQMSLLYNTYMACPHRSTENVYDPRKMTPNFNRLLHASSLVLSIAFDPSNNLMRQALSYAHFIGEETEMD